MPTVVQGQFNYTIDTNLTIIITAYTDSAPSAIIPNVIQGLPVATLAAGAFGQVGITNVVVPANLTNIVDGALAAGNLLAINVDLNNSAYSSSNGVLFNKNQSTILQYPLARVGAYSIPSGVISIGRSAFMGCTTLSTITLPNHLGTINDNAFAGCSALTNVTVPDSVTNIGSGGFASCTSLTNVNMGGGVITIGDSAFANCSALGSIQIPNSVGSIGDSAFGYCGLRDIAIPNSVAYLGMRAFISCASLTNVTLGTRITNILDYTFYGCLSLANAPIGNGILYIGKYVFQNCSSLASVRIPETVTNIDTSAFASCGLYSLTLSTFWIGEAAFYGCNNLTNVIINNGGYIGRSAFAYCRSLATVTIGRDVVNIGGWAFSQCPELTGVYFQGTPPLLDCCNQPACCVFLSDAPHSILYFLPGAPGWTTSFADRPAVPISLSIQTQDGSFGIRSNQFGFNITGSYGLPAVVVEAATGLAKPTWYPLQTNTLSGSSVYFSDPQWTNYPNRFYRVRWP